MFNQKIEKTVDELFLELREHLKILRDDILLVGGGKYERVKVVASSLRALICNNTKGNRGLLAHLVQLTGFIDGIERDKERIPLADYLAEPIFKSIGRENYELTRCDIIRQEAQQDGLAHAALQRSRQQFEVNSVFEMGKSAKTNPRVGFYLSTGYQVLEFGQRFLSHYNISLDDNPPKSSHE
jgi:hypothetical protein